MAEKFQSHGKDRQLLSKCISGDKKASETFVRQFSDLVYSSVRYTLINKQVTYNSQDLEDLHNSVFLQLFERNCKKLRQYKGRNGCSLATWIRIVTVRMVLNDIRKKGHDTLFWQKKRIPLEDLPELKEAGMDSLKTMEMEEQMRLVHDGIKRLHARDRLLMTLHFVKGLSIKETAETMCISIENAYTTKHRAMKKLRSYIE